MHSGTIPNEKSSLPRWSRAAFALLLAMLLVWGANPGHAAGEETITYIHTDISGNPLAATDENGNVVWKESYQAYGTRWQQDPNSAQQTQWFHGKEQDASSGLQYFGARYYDPAIGRFLGVDPLGFQDGNLHSFNRYAYGNNNPLRYLDPDGNNAFTAFGGLLTEGYNLATGNEFNGAMVWGALQDGYNGEGAGFLRSAGEDILIFGGGTIAGATMKGLNLLKLRYAGSIRNVNTVGGKMNCINCAIATDATLAGKPASALNGGPYSINVLEKFFGSRFGSAGPISNVSETMLAAGTGARGIVFGSRGSGEVGHVFNAVNQNGVVRFLDGQTGRAASLEGFKDFRLLRTN